MRAIQSAGLPGTFESYFGMLSRPRRGVPEGLAMPRIERSTSECVIEPDWLSAYCDSVGLTKGATLPPLALQLAAAPLHLAILADERFPFRAFGLLHVSQRIEQPAAIASDARMMLHAFTEPAEPSPRGMRFRLVTEATVAGKVVQRAETLALSPSGGKGGARAKSDQEADLGAPRFEDVLEVPESIGRRYASIAGDFNPIHQHAWLARPFGFQRAIVHGTWTVGRALAMTGLPTSEAFEVAMRFRKPVSLPSRVRVLAYRQPESDLIRVMSADGSTVHTEIEVRAR